VIFFWLSSFEHWCIQSWKKDFRDIQSKAPDTLESSTTNLLCFLNQIRKFFERGWFYLEQRIPRSWKEKSTRSCGNKISSRGQIPFACFLSWPNTKTLAPFIFPTHFIPIWILKLGFCPYSMIIRLLFTFQYEAIFVNSVSVIVNNNHWILSTV